MVKSEELHILLSQSGCRLVGVVVAEMVELYRTVTIIPDRIHNCPH